MPIKVAIVEDDSRFRESLAVVVDGVPGFRCVGAFGNAEAALKELPRDWPDAVLMDINLPEMSGIQCVARLKELRPALQIIMLTVYVDDDQIFQSLQAGASGYLIKKTPHVEIFAALKEVQQGGSPMSGMIARRVVQFFQQRKESTDETQNLSKRELEILGLLAKGYQYKEIADQLSLSFFTVRIHIHRIYEKLHVRSRTEAVVKFLGSKKS
jgi:DNA-binding NarL/FixJ family response regulator